MISRARISDLLDLHALETICFAEAWSQISLSQLLENPDYLVLLERSESQQPQAYLIGWRIGADVELARIGVVPEARGQGKSGRILSAALEIWRANGAQNVWLEVRQSNIIARGLYESRGFKPVGKRPNYYADGETALVLGLQIASPSIPQ